MAGLPKCSDAMINPRVTAGDACFLGTNRARMFHATGSILESGSGSILESAKAWKFSSILTCKNYLLWNGIRCSIFLRFFWV